MCIRDSASEDHPRVDVVGLLVVGQRAALLAEPGESHHTQPCRRRGALVAGGERSWAAAGTAACDGSRRLREEGCPLTDDEQSDDVDARVVLRRAVWWPGA